MLFWILGPIRESDDPAWIHHPCSRTDFFFSPIPSKPKQEPEQFFNNAFQIDGKFSFECSFVGVLKTECVVWNHKDKVVKWDGITGKSKTLQARRAGLR